MKDTIHILCATDNKYAPYCGVMLTSLLLNQREEQYHIYIFADSSISEDNRLKFKILSENYGCAIDVIEIDNHLLADCPVNLFTNITLATYYRLLAPQILPEVVHRVIYLDCDLIIKGSLRNLWEINLQGKAIAGVVDCEAYNCYIYERLGLPVHDQDYFNAGVTVYNLDFWRQHSVAKTAFEYITHNAEKLFWMDQDVLNVVLKNFKALLPLEYNFETIYYLPKNWCNYGNYLKSEIIEKGKHPLIIHYNGPHKPWSFRYYGAPYYDDWDAIRKVSLWKDCREIKPIHKYLKYLIKRHILLDGISQAIQFASSLKPDVVYCSCIHEITTTKNLIKQIDMPEWHILSGATFCERYQDKGVFWYPWGFLFRREWLTSLNYPFVEKRQHEDRDWVAYVLSQASSVCNSNTPMYRYVNNPFSTCRTLRYSSICDHVASGIRHVNLANHLSQKCPRMSNTLLLFGIDEIYKSLRLRNLTKFEWSDNKHIYNEVHLKPLLPELRCFYRQNLLPKQLYFVLFNIPLELLALAIISPFAKFGRRCISVIRSFRN